MNEKWFLLGIADIEKKLKTNAASGLTRRAARSRGNRGAGHLFYLPKKSVWKLCVEILSDFSLIILLLGAIFSLFFEIDEYLRGLTVLIISILALGFCAVMYFRSQRTVESLTTFFYPTAKVIRGGRLFSVDYRSIVVGDVILLEPGDVVCVDARLITSNNLKVKMRTSSEGNYISLEKNAEGYVDTREQRAREMVNMVHGGSIIESGSARAVVTALGKYTYLGAMTGGIPLEVSRTQPKLLVKLRKHSSKLNIILLITVLPFSIISLLLGNMLSENESVLSVAFLTALAIAATTMSQLTCTLLQLYYTHKIRKLVINRNSAVIKSVDAFDNLSATDYIFMLDGCAVTDGILHFDTAICPEGELRNYTTLNPTARVFTEYVSLYHMSATQMLTTGVSGAGDCFFGIKEFVDKTGVDTEALKIRCAVTSYIPGNMFDIPERIVFNDMGASKCLTVWRSMSAIRTAKWIMIGGVKQRLNAEGIKSLERSWIRYHKIGATPIIFALSTEEGQYSDTCIIGMLMLKEGIDDNLRKNLTYIERSGCKVISFVRKGNIPKIPYALIGKGCVSKFSFEQNNLPITYNFGSISAYADFSDDDIIELVSFAHSEGKRVVVVGFTESALGIASKADGFVSCFDIYPRLSGYLNEELQTSDVAGQKGSVNCIQTVKERADCLISRPRKGHGGLASLVSALISVKSVYSNISDYLRYIVAVQFVRLIIVGVPMLVGDAILDARHVILCSYILDLFAFFAFMLRSGYYKDKREKNYCYVDKLKGYFIGDNAIIISSIASSATAILLPIVFDLFNSEYHYKVEGLFTSLLVLHLTAFVCVYYGSNIKDMLYVYKNKLLIVEFAIVAVLWTFCFIFDPIGALFGIEGTMPLLYFILSVLPVAVFAGSFVILNRKKQMKKF